MDLLFPDPKHRALLDRIRTELEALDQQLQSLKNLSEWEAPRSGISPRDEAIGIQDIIASLAKEAEPRAAWQFGTANYESIVRKAQERGFALARVDAWLKKLETTGHVYRPSANRYLLRKPT